MRAEAASILAGLRAGDGPLSVCARPSSLMAAGWSQPPGRDQQLELGVEVLGCCFLSDLRSSNPGKSEDGKGSVPVRVQGGQIAHEEERPAAPPRVLRISVSLLGSSQGISVTERLFVVSVRVADVNWTVIGGLHDGLNVAVAVSV
jgi:hypothetical protein